jgi:hypothetical protein
VGNGNAVKIEAMQQRERKGRVMPSASAGTPKDGREFAVMVYTSAKDGGKVLQRPASSTGNGGSGQW